MSIHSVLMRIQAKVWKTDKRCSQGDKALSRDLKSAFFKFDYQTETTTLKYLINEYTCLDIMTFFNRKSNFTTNFFSIFVVENVENYKNMANIDHLLSKKK